MTRTLQGEAKENADYGKQDSNVSKNNAESVCGINNELARREDFGVHQKNCALIICEVSDFSYLRSFCFYSLMV